MGLVGHSMVHLHLRGVYCERQHLTVWWLGINSSSTPLFMWKTSIAGERGGQGVLQSKICSEVSNPCCLTCVWCVYLTTVFMEDMGEAMQDAVTTATVGASFLNPLAMRNRTTAPTGRQKRARITGLWKEKLLVLKSDSIKWWFKEDMQL